jgi:hypothetical protein
LATVLQGNIHPASRGFTWWKDERPAGLPSAAAHFSAVAQEYGLAPVKRIVDLMAGDLALIVGTPETDPVAADAEVTYIGPMVFQRSDAVLPPWVEELCGKNGHGRRRPIIWVYSGNPRYFTAAGPCDSIVVIRAAIAALADEPMDVVLTTGYQELPEEFGTLPRNFRHAAYVPGPLMAEQCDLIVFHGGHSSVMTTLKAGTPAVIIPTITERESNARRLASLGAGEVVMPITGADGEKLVDVTEFAMKVKRVERALLPSICQARCRIHASLWRRMGRREAYRRGRARPRSEMIQKSAATSRKIRLATPAITRITWNLIQRSRSCCQFPGSVEGVHMTIC